MFHLPPSRTVTSIEFHRKESETKTRTLQSQRHLSGKSLYTLTSPNQIETTLRVELISIYLKKQKKTKGNEYDEGVGEHRHSYCLFVVCTKLSRIFFKRHIDKGGISSYFVLKTSIKTKETVPLSNKRKKLKRILWLRRYFNDTRTMDFPIMAVQTSKL